MGIKIYDGINIIFGMQGQGKSYVCTAIAVQELLKNRKKVLSNYPIIFDRPLTLYQKLINAVLDYYKCDEKRIWNYLLKRQIPEKLQTYVWRDSFTGAAIKDALIIIDESHDKYTGAYAFELNKEDRKFFSRLRHNGNAVYLMSQSYEDIHPFIRRRTAFVHEMKKRKWVFFRTPSCFFIETYSSIKNYINKDIHKFNKKAEKTIFNKQKIPFSLLVAAAYNTHYFRDIHVEPELELWEDELEGKTIPSKFNMDIEDEPKEKKRRIRERPVEIEL